MPADIAQNLVRLGIRRPGLYQLRKLGGDLFGLFDKHIPELRDDLAVLHHADILAGSSGDVGAG